MTDEQKKIDDDEPDYVVTHGSLKGFRRVFLDHNGEKTADSMAVWIPVYLNEEGMEDVGYSIEILSESVDDVIALLTKLKDAKAHEVQTPVGLDMKEYIKDLVRSQIEEQGETPFGPDVPVVS